MAPNSLVFLHLSDIHFQRWSGSSYDIDEDLRNELLIDAAEVLKKLGRPDGILVTGDIAFGGISKEYDLAKKWLTELCEKLGRTLEYVWTVPGNHDVDWEHAKTSSLLAAIHNELRQSETKAIDGAIRKYMGDIEAAKIIFRPISEYNSFAATFQCQISPQKPTWQQDFPLGDGAILRINGLNSTMVSDHLDGVEKQVILGEYQCPKRTPGVVHLVMCHHPPDWWKDNDLVEQKMNSRANIELFGHKHSQRLCKINSTLRLTAGAVHPYREALNWKPCYNWLKVSVSGNNTGHKLDVEVYPRIWNNGDSKFIPDSNSCSGQDHRLVSFDLEPWTLQPSEKKKPERESGVLKSTSPSSPSIGLETKMSDPIRILTYRFFDLAHVVRIDIARDLKLLRDEDEGLEDYELFNRILTRAAKEKLLDQLWDIIEKQHGDKKYISNPFK
jgi:predicted MPP superfamily phosphohydrolase